MSARKPSKMSQFSQSSDVSQGSQASQPSGRSPRSAPGDTTGKPVRKPAGSGTRNQDRHRARNHARHRARIAGASVALVAAALTATLAVTMTGDGGGSRTDTPLVAATSGSSGGSGVLTLARRDAGDPMAVGRADAPVVIVEYSDFQCPYCGRFARETKPELVREYVERGVLRIEWRNFPIFGEESERAARAAWAAGMQGRFWEFHDVAFERDRRRNSGAFGTDELAEMARRAGVPDLERFRADLESDGARESVRADLEEGYRLGVASTPAFLVNGRPVLGAQPTATFRELVDAAAKAADR